VIIVESLIQVVHASGDNGRRSSVTGLYELLMLLVIIVSEAAFHVYTSCSCYWLHATEVLQVYCSCYW